MAELAAAKPSVIILASHIPDGVAFRRAMLGAGGRCPDRLDHGRVRARLRGELGADAIGIFASDRPTGGFQPSALDLRRGPYTTASQRAWATTI